MDIEWSKMRFANLEAEFRREDGNWDDPQYLLRVRYENIMNYLDSDRILPPIPRAKKRITPALAETLARLPEDEFYTIDQKVRIIVPDDDVIALNVSPLEIATGDIFTLVLFHQCWKLSPKALVGLMAHEMAHTFVTGEDYSRDEAVTDALACSWGFGEELDLLASEKQQWI